MHLVMTYTMMFIYDVKMPALLVGMLILIARTIWHSSYRFFNGFLMNVTLQYC